MKKTLTLVLVLGMSITWGSGCRTSPQSTNPKVAFAATLLGGADVVDSVANGLAAANEAVTQLRATEPDYYAKVHPLLVKLARLNDKAIIAIRKAKAGDSSADWEGAISDIASGISPSDLTTFGFKNPNSAAVAQVGMATLIAALNAIPKVRSAIDGANVAFVQHQTHYRVSPKTAEAFIADAAKDGE